MVGVNSRVMSGDVGYNLGNGIRDLNGEGAHISRVVTPNRVQLDVRQGMVERALCKASKR